MFDIVAARLQDVPALSPLTALFRVTLQGYRGLDVPPDAISAEAELTEYIRAGMPVYGAKLPDGAWASYMVLRTEESTVWVESLYVLPTYRRMGIASALFRMAEEQASRWGETTVFNYVHPRVCF